MSVVYLNREDVVSFFQKGDTTFIGTSYTWEGEQVTHIYLTHALHSYGLEQKVLFTKCIDDKLDTSLYAFVVCVSSEQDVSVYEVIEGKLEVREMNFIPAKTDLYSRNKGILEIGILEKKRVMIVGLGSFGSQIAIELAKAGVGEFSLFDFDRVELHNLARHTCTIQDLGRLKTDALYDAIVGKNPYAKVEKFPVNINENKDLLEAEVAKADIVICATDNNVSRFNLSEALVKYQKIGIFGRAVTRAEGGDVFRYAPGGPCYCCLIGAQWYDAAAEEVTNEQSARENGQIAAYVSSEEADAMVQVGLSSDISPICNMMVKLALVELSRGQQSGISCLEQEFVYDYYMWANRRERRHSNWAPMPSAGNMPTIMRWYGAHIQRNDSCPLCSNSVQLDAGDEWLDRLSPMDGMEDIDLSTIE